ncbi:MAG: PAS domain-containing protein [Myxococcales bacterium]
MTQNFETVPFAVIVVGTDGCISSGNAIAHRMLSQPTGALRGRRFEEVMVEGIEQVYAVFEAGTPQRFQARMLKADGRVLDVSLAVEPTNRDGSGISSLTVVCKPLPPWTSLRPPPQGSSADI